MKIKEEYRQIVFSYARSALGAVLAVWWAGETSATALAKAGLAAVVPPLIRWLNANDEAFGRTK